ncbi:hypothetical protein B4144_2832 [Bacillus atrophaeus]|nr:hypothetical protein B4144_2832 [Bacillus atrophaeus]
MPQMLANGGMIQLISFFYAIMISAYKNDKKECITYMI